MADTKISALPASGALTGAEIIPLVQAGATSRTTPTLLAKFGRTAGTFNVLDYGAVGNGVTDDYAAFVAALAALYANKGGTLVVPYTTAGYVLGASLSIDTAQYAAGAGILVQLSGNLFQPSHTGWCFDVKSNFFGANNSTFKPVLIDGGGAQIRTSNAAAAGGVRFSDCVRCAVKDLSIGSYAAGSGLQFYCSTANLSTWCELNRASNIGIFGCLNGLHTKTLTPATPGSFLGCMFDQITVNGTVNNSILFNLEGSLTNAVLTGCGGYYNQSSSTGGKGFNLNGHYQGCTFVSPWIDSAGAQSTATDITFGAAFTANLAQLPTLVSTTWISLPTGWRSKLNVVGPLLSNGTVGTNSSPSGNVREVLTAGRIYYVATTGSDANDGLTSSTPFLTPQKALAVIGQQIDCGGFGVTIQLADGTYTGQLVIPRMVGQTANSDLIIAGNATTPTNVTLTSASSNGGTIECPEGAACQLQNFQTTNTGATNPRGISARGGRITLGAGIAVGAAGAQIYANAGGLIEGSSTITVTANSDRFMLASFGGYISFFGTVAFGTRTYVNQVFYASTGSIEINGTLTGTVTGTRYAADMNGVIQTYTGNINYLPGSVAGYTATGGQYA